MPDLSSALEECLTAINQKRNLQEVLKRYPADRDELIDLLRLSVDLGGLSAPAGDPAFRLRARNRMLAEASRYRVRRRRNPLAALARPVIRLVASAAVAGGLVVGGLTAAAASTNALPGDPLYPIKIAAETVQLATTFDTTAHIRLELRFAEVRLDEAQRLIAAGRVQDGVRLIGEYDTEVALLDRTLISTSLDPHAAADLRRLLGDRQAHADASLMALAGSLNANGNSEAAAAVEKTQSHVDQALERSRQEMQARSGNGAASQPSARPAPPPMR